MSYQNNIVDSKIQKTWDEDFKHQGFKVKPYSALNYELENNFPSHVFVQKVQPYETEATDIKDKFMVGHLTFLMHGYEPMYRNFDGDIRWFEIEPMNRSLVLLRINDLLLESIAFGNVEGFLIPLQESNTFDRIDDANAYLHNLMFWESIISPHEGGPLLQRLFWLSQKLYAMRGEQLDGVLYLRRKGVSVLNIATDSAMELVKAAESLSREKTHSEPAVIAVRASKGSTNVKKRKCSHVIRSRQSLKLDADKLKEVTKRRNEILQNIDILKRQLVTETDRLEEQSKLCTQYYDSIIRNIGISHGVVKSRSAKGPV